MPGKWNVFILSPTGGWILFAEGYDTRDAAEWAVGKWKMANKMTGDPFRYEFAA